MKMGSEDLRMVEVQRDDQWVRVAMKDVKKGDRYRLFEEDGTLYVATGGATEFTALEDAHWDEEQGSWGVSSEWLGQCPHCKGRELADFN